MIPQGTLRKPQGTLLRPQGTTFVPQGTPRVPKELSVVYTDEFVASCCTTAGYTSTQPAAIYHAATDRTYYSFEAYNGIKLEVRIKYFFHDTANAVAPALNGPAAAWSGDFYVSDDTLPIGNLVAGEFDNHGVPALCVDAEGYIWIFFGAHASNMKCACSAAPNSITTWNDRSSTLSTKGSFTYPHPVLIGSAIYLFMRGNATTDLSYLSLVSGTPSAGNVTFSARLDLVNYNTAQHNRFYFGNLEVDGNDVYLPSAWSNNADTLRRDVYGYVYNVSTGALRNIPSTVSVAAGSLPIDLTTAKASFRIVNMEATSLDGGTPSQRLDIANNRVHYFYTQGPDTGGPYENRHLYWTGSAFSTPAVISALPSGASMGYSAICGVLRPGGGGSLTSQFTTDGGQGASRGGSQSRSNWTLAGGWTAPVLERAQGVGQPALNNPTSPYNAHQSAFILYGQEANSLVTTSAQIGIIKGYIDSLASVYLGAKFGPDVQSIITRMATEPSIYVCTQMQTLIDALRADTTNQPWVRAYQIYCQFAHTAAAALIPWKSNRFPLVPNGTPVFAVYGGYTMGPTTASFLTCSGLACNSIPDTAFSMGVFALTPGSGSNLCGTQTTAANLNIGRSTGSAAFSKAASAGSASYIAPAAGGLGIYGSGVRSGTAQTYYDYGVLAAGPTTATNAASNSEAICFGRRGSNACVATILGGRVGSNSWLAGSDLTYYTAWKTFYNSITPGTMG